MLKTFLLNCDFIGVSPRIYYKGNFRFKTQTGGILSLLLSLFLIIISIYFIYIFLSKESFTLYENLVTITRAHKIFKKEDFSIILLDKYFQNIENSSQIYSIYADIWTDKRYYDDGIFKSNTNITPVSIEKCNITNYDKFELWKNEKLINDSICFSEEAIESHINSTGIFGETGYTGIVFWISLCTNSTYKNNCYPIEKSKEILDNVFVYVKILDIYFDHGNLNNNAIEYIHSDLIQASSSIYKRVWYLFREVEYISDEGILFMEKKTKKFTTLSSSYNSVDQREKPTIENAFFALSLNMDGTKKLINRKYYKIQNLFADINGLFQIAYFFSFSINFIYCYNRLSQNIINECVNNYIDYSEYSIFTRKISLNATSSILLNSYLPQRQITVPKKNKNNYYSSFKINEINSIKLKRIKSSYSNNFLCPNNNNNDYIMHSNSHKNIIKDNQLLSSEKYRNKIIDKLENKFHKIQFKLNFFQNFNLHLVLCPKNLYFHKNKNLRNFSIIQEIISKQFEVINILKKINLIDKFDLSFFSNENIRNIFHRCYNPQTNFFFKKLFHENIVKTKIEKDDEVNILREILNFEINEKLINNNNRNILL